MPPSSRRTGRAVPAPDGPAAPTTPTTPLTPTTATSPASPAVFIRLAVVDDAEGVRQIYNNEVTSTTATFDLVPRSLADQQEWLQQRTGAFAAIVAVDATSGEVLGFAALSPYKERAAYRTSVEDSVYVRENSQGRGVGRMLLTHLLDLADQSGFHSVFARIEASGTPSRALHERYGFQLVGIEREVGRKFNKWLSVALMQCVLHERAASTDRGQESGRLAT